MTIPHGDLAPMRKHRRYGRHRSRWPVVLAVVAVAAVAAVVYVIQQSDDEEVPLATPSCAAPVPTHAPAPSAPARVTAVRLPAPGQVRLRLLNGTPRDGLARVVANELAKRGFRVSATGNAPRALVGASRVYYGPTGRPAALLVSAHVLGSSVVPVPSAAKGAVDVVLGSTFARLRTLPETSAYVRVLTTTGVPATKPTSAPSPSCR